MDFSRLHKGGVAEGVATVARGLLEHGVTAFCPTIITSGADYYASVSTAERLAVCSVVSKAPALPPSASTCVCVHSLHSDPARDGSE